MRKSNSRKVPKANSQKVQLGQRWVCYECDARFYDLNRPEPVCPRCKADQRESPTFEKPKRGRRKKAAKVQVPPPGPVEETPVSAEDVENLDPELDPDRDLNDSDGLDDAPLEDEFGHA